MNALTGMEKFSHLEDKIYLTIEYAKKMRDEKEQLEREAAALRADAANAANDNRELEEKVAALLEERDLIQNKVAAMLDAIAVLDSGAAEAAGR